MPIKRPRRPANSNPSDATGKGLTSDSADITVRSNQRPTVSGIYLSPNHEHLAVITRYEQLSLYRLDGEILGNKVGTHWISRLGRITWPNSGTMLAFVNSEGKAEALDILSGKSKLFGPATATALYPDGSRLAVLNGSTLTIWHVDPPAVTYGIVLPGRADYRSNLMFTLNVSANGERIACATDAGVIQILDAKDLRIVSEFSGHRGVVTDMEWLGPNKLATASEDHTVRIWDVPKGQAIRVLEVGERALGISYSSALDCLIGWTRDECYAWSVSSGEILLQEPLPVAAEYGYRHVSSSPHGTLLARLNGPKIGDIKFSHGLESYRGQAPNAVSTYANAKILLLGDSGVGKSGLALVLAGEAFRPTESTHARRVWKMPLPELNDNTRAEREVLLWDLAGQPGYRIVHQLHLSDGTVAAILCDPRSETAPLIGIGYWARALRNARSSGLARRGALPTFLVGARTDLGVISVSDDRISETLRDFGFRGYIATSAKEGWGIEELRSSLLSAIDWDQIPVVTSSALFAAARNFVLEQKATAETLLTPLTSLLAAFRDASLAAGPVAQSMREASSDRDSLDKESAETRLRNVFEGCVARLQSAGLVKRLAFGDLVLLQPELIDVYAGAVVNAARDEPDGLGSMLESRVLNVDFRLPEQERIADRQQEKLLIIATLEELIRHEIVLREETEDGVQLIFPAAFRRDLPEVDERSDLAVEFAFEGPVDNIYATLVVRLARSMRFTRRSAWQSAAQFEADSRGMCTVHLMRSDEGRGVLQVGYDEGTAELVRFQFERFVMTHLQRRAIRGTVRRTRLYICPECDVRFSVAQAEKARSRGRISLTCPVDETRVPLDDYYVDLGLSHDEVTAEMDASADAARSIAAASSIILGKEETTDYDVFLCHHSADKPIVRAIAQQLREHGILAWLDADELRPGRPWQEELEKQICHIRSAAVFVGPSGIGQWQNEEMRSFLDEFIKRRCPIIPVLLPGSTITALPTFLRRMTRVDLRTQGEDGIAQLIWGITGRRPIGSGLDPTAD